MPVNTYPDELAKMLPVYDDIDIVVDGGERGVKAAGTRFLPQPPALRRDRRIPGTTKIIDEYAAYAMRANVLPVCEEVVSKIAGMVLNSKPTLAMPSTELQQWAEDNVTLTAPATSLEGLIYQVVVEQAKHSRGCLYVDMDAALGRPYVRMFNARNTVDAGYDHLTVRSESGEAEGAQPMLTIVRLREFIREPVPDDKFETEEVEQWLVVELSHDTPLTAQQFAGAERLGPNRYPFGYLQVQPWRQARNAQTKKYEGEFFPYGPPRVPMRRQAPLWFVPVVPFNRDCLSFCVMKPLILGLVDLVLSEYRNSADLEHVLYRSAAGIILHGAGFSAQEQETLRDAGPAAAWLSQAPSQLNYVSTQGAAGAEIAANMERKEKQMSVSRGRLLMGQQKNVAESGASLAMQFKGDDAELVKLSSLTAMAVEEALVMFAWWMDPTAETPDDVRYYEEAGGNRRKRVSVELNQDFFKHAGTPEDAVAIEAAMESGVMTERDGFSLLERLGLLDQSTTFEAWKQNRDAKSTADMGGGSSSEMKAMLADIAEAQAAGDAAGVAAGIAEMRRMMGDVPIETGAGA